MKISSAFPSQFLKAADLQDRPVRVTMDKVMIEEIGDDTKPVLHFLGKEKGMVLNKTNANNISATHGDDTDAWYGKEIELFPTLVDFQGKSVEAIRVRIPKGRPHVMTNAPAAAPAPSDRNPPPATIDDEISF